MRLSFALLTAALGTLVVVEPVALAMPVTRQADMLTVTQQVTPTADGLHTTVTATQAPITNIMGVERRATPGGIALTVSARPWPKWYGASTFANDTAARSAIGAFVKAYSDHAASSVCTLLNSPASSSRNALVNYFQAVTINGKPARINGTLIVRDNCSHHFLGVKVTHQFERMLYAVYTQGAIAQGLPTGPGWNLPKPGILQWELLAVDTRLPNAQPQPVTIGGKTWHDVDYLCSTRDTSSQCPVHADGPLGPWGYWDQPQDISAPGNKGEIYHCALGSSGICDTFDPTGLVADTASDGTVIDFNENVGRDALIAQVLRPMMKQYNAQSLMLDYGRTIAPKYTKDGKPITAVSVTLRKLLAPQRFFFISPGAGAKYKNKGEYGFLLKYVFDRSLTTQGQPGTASIQLLTKSVLSPQQSYSKEVPAEGGSDYYAGLVIDPFSTTKVYPWQNDQVNGLPPADYVTVAPIQ